jgi:pimeloyl-ACP methyl ester carboxylesterase
VAPVPDIPDVPGVEHQFLQSGQVKLHVAVAGDGPPALLLHGWPQHWYMWRRVIPDLAEDHRVICPDLRGFGWSEAPDSRYTKEELAGDILALLDVLGLERIRLIGHDWGAFVGFLLCLRAPERFESFLAVSIIQPWARPGLGAALALPALAYQPLIGLPVVGRVLQRRTPFYDALFALSGGRRVWTATERDAFVEPLRQPARAEAASRLYRSFLTRELPAIARGRYAGERLTTPTILVVGRRDPVAGRIDQSDAGGHAEDLRFERVESGHFLPEERPDVVVERFTDQVAGPLAPAPTPMV